MITLDEIFYKEYTNTMKARRANIVDFNLNDLPILWDCSKVVAAELWRRNIICDGITEPFFESLNFKNLQTKEMFKIVPRQKLEKKLYTNRGEVRYDLEGKIMTEYVPVTQGSVAINCSVNIRKPYSAVVSDGFKYVDFEQKTSQKTGKKIIEYTYIVPKKNCFPINYCALVLTLSKFRNFYSGYRITLLNGVQCFLQVIPMTPKTPTIGGIRILQIGTKPNFNTEIKSLLKLWEQNGIIPIIEEVTLDPPVKGVTNLVFEGLQPTLYEYHPYDLSNSLDTINNKEKAEKDAEVY